MDGLGAMFEILGAGGDAATMALAWVVLKQQARLMRLELRVFGFGNGKGGNS